MTKVVQFSFDANKNLMVLLDDGTLWVRHFVPSDLPEHGRDVASFIPYLNEPKWERVELPSAKDMSK